jgi:hypothetical protein
MADPPTARHSASPTELQARLAAARVGSPHLVYRDAAGAQQLVELANDQFTIGRGSGCDIRVDWDVEVSRVHAELRRTGPDWAVEDNGLSRNGTFVNGTRVSGRRRLLDGDVLRIGQTLFVYAAPVVAEDEDTVTAGGLPTSAVITPAQRRVLVALCRPYGSSASYPTPASNQAIADELHLSLDAVKSQIRALFARFDVEQLPQNQKRARLVELALRSGVVSRRDLG